MTTPQTAVEVLIAARELISAPERWTQGVHARDVSGDVATRTTAVCWCGFGAVWEVVETPFSDLSDECERLLDRAVGCPYVDWQDSFECTHAEVLAAFDKAIELARAEAA